MSLLRAVLTSITFLGLVGFLEPSSSFAKLAREGTEFQINTVPIPFFASNSFLSISDGRWLVVWSGPAVDGDEFQIWARFSDPGSAPFVVSLPRPNGSHQSRPKISARNGQALIVWNVGGGATYGRQINLESGEFETLPFEISEPEMTPLGHAVTLSGDSEYLVVWAERDVRARQVTADGVLSGPSFEVEEVASGIGYRMDLVAENLLDGSTLVMWIDESPRQLQGRIIPIGSPPLDPFVVVSDQLDDSAFSVCVETSGNFVIAWTGLAGTRRISLRRFDPNGAPIGPVVIVDDSSSNSQLNSDVACLPDGRIIVVWEQIGSPRRILGKVLSGKSVEEEFTMKPALGRNGVVSRSKVSLVSSEDFVLTWSDCEVLSADDLSCALLGQRFSLSEGESCAGDCDGDGVVRVNELTQAVGAALSGQPELLKQCLAVDTSLNYGVEIAEIVAAVGNALGGCAGSPVTNQGVRFGAQL